MLELNLNQKIYKKNKKLSRGNLKTVRSTDKTKALVEGVDNARVSNIMIIPSNISFTG